MELAEIINDKNKPFKINLRNRNIAKLIVGNDAICETHLFADLMSADTCSRIVPQ